MRSNKLLIGLTAFLATLTTLNAAVVHAAIPADERSSTTGGFGAWMIDSLFEAGSLGNMSGTAGFLGTVIQPFSLVCMLVVVGIVLVKSAQHVLIVAQAKDPESSPIAMTWAPLHLVFAVVLAMPLPSGYSAGQYVAIWVAEQSNFLGNVIAEKTVDGSSYAVFTEVPLPAVRQTVLALVDSQVCQTVMNELGEYMMTQGDSRMQVNTRALNQDQIQTLFGKPNTSLNGGSLTRRGVAYEARRIGPSGDFLNRPTEINTTCGSLIVEYDGYFHDASYVDFDDSVRTDDCTAGIMCGSTNDLSAASTRSDDKAKAAEAFSSAHETITQEFLGAAGVGNTGGSTIPSAVEALTYDIGTYFDALTKRESMEEYTAQQANEASKVGAASKQTIQEIERLQRAVYRSYGDALNNLRSENTNTKDSHSDAVMRTGWTVLGLYWFQQQSYNSQVLKAVNFSVNAEMDTQRLIASVREVTGDERLAKRLEDRIHAYKAAVNSAILNSRLDENPLSRGQGGTVLDDSLSDSVRASEIRESLPTYLDTMVSSAQANQGATISDPYGFEAYGSPSTFFRNYVFPTLVWSLRDENMVTGLVNLGHNLIVVSEAIYVLTKFWAALDAWGNEANTEGAIAKLKGFLFAGADQGAQEAVSVGTGTFIWKLINEFMADLGPLLLYLFLLGLFLAFYLPAIVMIQWIIGLVQWIIYIIEATVVIPLWAILFASDMGQKAFAPQTAQQGLIHLVSILFYPALMVIGFTIGIKVLDLISYFAIDYMMLGFLNITSGYTFGLVSSLAGLTIIGIIAYQLIVRVFSGMLELHDRAIGWIGNRATFGENQSEQATRSALVGIISRGESMGRKAGGGGGRPPTAKPDR